MTATTARKEVNDLCARVRPGLARALARTTFGAFRICAAFCTALVVDAILLVVWLQVDPQSFDRLMSAIVAAAAPAS
jgi:hypothetical protein